MLWILHIINLVLVLPMMGIGLAMGLSGGGHTPIFQKVGLQLFLLSPIVAISSVIASQILWWLDIHQLAYAVDLIPFFFWSVLILRVRFDHLFSEDQST